VAAVAGAVWNVDRLTAPVDDSREAYRDVGLQLRAHLRPGDKVADRKPYIPFYAGGRYVEIPNDNYDDIISYLNRENVRFLSLEYNVTVAVRPVLIPLLTDAAAILGELRYAQLLRHPEGVLVYQRTGADADPSWRRLATADQGRIASPSWTPDGRRILFSIQDENASSIHVVPADGSSPPARVVGTPARDDHAAVSPDGTLLAFSSTMGGSYDVYTLDVTSGETSRLTEDPANDGAPAWVTASDIVFVSDRSGRNELWRLDVDTGEATRLTRLGDLNYPAVSPSGNRVAFVRKGHGVGVLDLENGRIEMLPGPKNVQYPPSWSRDERFLAVTANDWGSVDVYILMPEAGRHLLLTKNRAFDERTWFDGFPVYSPDNERLAVVSNHEGRFGLYVLEGLEPYYRRLIDPVELTTMEESGPE
jgi:Tol biopolymer transport system component